MQWSSMTAIINNNVESHLFSIKIYHYKIYKPYYSIAINSFLELMELNTYFDLDYSNAISDL